MTTLHTPNDQKKVVDVPRDGKTEPVLPRMWTPEDFEEPTEKGSQRDDFDAPY